MSPRWIGLLALSAWGCQGETVQSASTDSSPVEDTVAAGDTTAGDTTAGDTTAGDTKTGDTTVSDTTSPVDTGAFEVPMGDAACTDGPVYRPETGATCPADMVVIPAGSFSAAAVGRMGTFAKPFCMDITEVTAGAYGASCTSGACVPSTSCGPPRTFGATGKGNHPINCVTWEQADAYCKGIGRRLPTDLEWEYAMRGAPPSGAGNLYPWGSSLSTIDRCRLCWDGSSGGGTCAVGSFPAGNSPQGVMDLSGGVEEWTATTEAGGHIRMGGSYNTTDPNSVGADYGRGGDIGADRSRGFRCVKSTP